MFATWVYLLNHFKGKNTSKVHSFRPFYVLILNVYMFMYFVGNGLCDKVPMVSIPLGFELSGTNKTTTWVSQNGVFEFGFLEGYLGGFRDDNVDDNVDDNDGFVVGIRYNLGKKAANLPVWTIAGGLRVSDSTTFRLSVDGRLVLFDESSDLIVWSSNTSNLGVEKASLLDNGNLVLLGSEDQVLWQSFSSPTNCLLPGQAIHFPQSLRAPSSSSITSYYNFVIRRSGELVLVWESNVTYWRSGAVSESLIGDVKEARFNVDGVFGVFDEKNHSIWSVTSKDFEDTSVSLRHLRIDSDGNVRIYAWDNKAKTWKVGWQAVDNQCDVFGSCGLYSLCGFNTSGPICSCLNDGSNGDIGTLGSDSEISGCQKLADLDNCKLRSSMIVLKHTVLYGLYPPHDSDIMLNEDDCKAYCSSDASCVAVTSKNDGSGLCTVKRTNFISGYSDPSQPSISFLKVCPVPQAVSAQKTSPQGNALATPLSSGRFLTHTNGNKFVSGLALIGLATALVFILVQIIAVWVVYQRRTSRVKSRIPFEKDALMNPLYSVLIRLSFAEIKELTSHFAYQLGPTIFKGLLLNRTPVIAKVLYNVVVTEKDFRAAVSILGGTHHRNLVALKGFCYEQKHKILIYEYVGYGSLEKWLFERENPKNHPLQERFEIALGVARGLSYLHVECQNCTPHGNLKLENIMLDENLVPKLMDFGLQGLIQGEAPVSSETMSERDIHKFGQILLQIVTCNKDPPIDADVNQLVNEIIETQTLEEDEECERVERIVKIALWCVQVQPFLRPSIGEVVKVLEGAFSVDRPPSSFAFRSVQKSLEIEEDPRYE